MLRQVTHRTFAFAGAALAVLLCAPVPLLAADSRLLSGVHKLLHELQDPWVWFGLGAQGLFFMRFFYQWLVSEKRGRSTIPIAFWYFSLAGAVSTFIYAAGRLDPAIMFGQMPACFFYIRNLMLIRKRAEKLRQAGLPPEAGSLDDGAELPD